jgi:hypothetical protein
MRCSANCAAKMWGYQAKASYQEPASFGDSNQAEQGHEERDRAIERKDRQIRVISGNAHTETAPPDKPVCELNP